MGEPAFDQYGGARTRLGYEFKYEFNDSWSFSQNTRHDAVNGKMRSMYANFWEVDLQGNGYGSDASAPIAPWAAPGMPPMTIAA